MSAYKDALIALALATFSLAAWLWLIPAFAGGSGEQTVMPRIAVALTGALSLLLLAASLVRASHGSAEAAAGGENDDPFLEVDRHSEPPHLFLIMAVWGVVLLFPQFFGLHLGSALAICLTFVIVGIRGPLALAVWTLLPIAVLHIVFEYGFSLRLPRGQLLTLLTG